MKKEKILLTSACALGAVIAVSISLFIWKSVTGGGVTPPAPVEEYCLVDFDSYGGSHVDAQKVKKGEKAVKPKDPSREPEEDYTFKGWLTDDGRDYDFSQVVTNDITLHADWHKKPDPTAYHTVRFEAGGGTIVAGSDTITVQDGSTISEEEVPVVVREGYETSEVEWWTEASGGTKFILGDEGTEVNQDYFLHARWGDIKTYTVQFKDIDDDTIVSEEQIVEYNHVVQRPVNPTKTGFAFDKWYCEDKETEFNFETPLTGKNTDITIYAKWTEVEPVFSEGIAMKINVTTASTVSFDFADDYQCKVIWGDGTIDSNRSHNYQVGSYMINIYGYGPLSSFGVKSGQACITDVVIKNFTKIYQKAFLDCSNLQTITFVKKSKLESIGMHAFEGCSSLSSVVIPSSVTLIDSDAFYHCSSLQTITFEEESKLKTISDCAFQSCSSLTSITIPSSVTSIGINPFVNCSSLTSINVDENNKVYEDRDSNAIIEKATNMLIIGCSSTIIPSSVTSIGEDAFYHCSSLSSIIIPSSVIAIYPSAFSNCSSLQTVAFEEGSKLQTISTFAFEGCSYLSSITIPSSVTSIGGYAFDGCSALTSITIPNSVISIGAGAFSGCSQLQTITFGEESKLESIEKNAFQGCPDSLFTIYNNCKYLSSANNPYFMLLSCSNSSITSVSINSSCVIIANLVFSGYQNLQSVIFEEGSQLKKVCESVFQSCSSLSSIAIPDGVTSIGSDAFSGCSSLASITIPSSVTSIGTNPFINCSSLTSISVDENNRAYEDRGSNAIIEKATNTLITGCSSTIIPSNVTSIGDYAFYGSLFTSISIPDSVTSIGVSAFQNCSSLTSITIPNSVTSIGESAFEKCSSLQVVAFEEESKLEAIDKSAFDDCFSLTSITIPNNVTSIGTAVFSGCLNLQVVAFEEESQLVSIGPKAFKGCSSLASINIPSGVTLIDNATFRECSSLTSITIHSSVTKISEYAFYKCSNLKTVTFERGSQLISIDAVAFSDCSSLTSINIPSSVTSIGDSAFIACSKLQSVSFGEKTKLKSIGGNAFYGCSSLTSITIPSSVTSIGKHAFYSCSSLQNVIFEEGSRLTSIGEGVFYKCSSITSITIPSEFTEINASTFYECSNLKTVIFEEGSQLTSIGPYAFFDCSSLASIAIPSRVTSIGEYAFYNCSNLQIVDLTALDAIPTLGNYGFLRCSETLKLYVKAGMVDAFKAAPGWSSYADNIVAGPVGEVMV